MKVLHINVNYNTSALHQTMMNHFSNIEEHVVFVPTYDKTNRIIEPSSNVVVSECFKKWNRLLFYKKQHKIRDSVEEKIDITQIDCIHAYTLFTDGNVAYKLSKKYNIPYVVAIRNTDVNVFFRYMLHLRHLGVRILKNASAVFFLSPAYKRKVIEKYVPNELRNEILQKSFIVPNGIDDFWLQNIFSRCTSEDESKRFCDKRINCIYAGGIDANKNIQLTLKALERLNNQGWNTSLTCVGRIHDRRIYNKLCKYPFFLYQNAKKKEELICDYRHADMFIMPSHTESFGLVYAEAMSQGLPIIYTRGQGFDGHFNDGEVGFSVSNNDYEELSKKVLDIVNDYTEISQNCTLKAVVFNWSEIVKKYEEIYSEIVKRL